MKDMVRNALTMVITIAGIVCGIVSGFELNPLQAETFKLLWIITGVSMAYCFIVGEISRNNSQMDKLWSITPIIFAWVVAAKSGMNARVVIMAVLITCWGARLTYNFAKKGAYSIKFWSGEEDYRWAVLRKHKPLTNKFVWALFDLIFICCYQNALVLATCFPLVAVMSSDKPLGFMDVIAAILVAACVAYEATADVQQMKFQNTKWKMIKEGKKLEELPAPYNKGFNTEGLWAVSRHPNYFAEQSTWVCVYLFCIAAGVVKYGVFNWSIIGCLLLIMLFMGSSTFGESITSGKYPLYKDYQKKVSKFFPGRKYGK